MHTHRNDRCRAFGSAPAHASSSAAPSDNVGEHLNSKPGRCDTCVWPGRVMHVMWCGSKCATIFHTRTRRNGRCRAFTSAPRMPPAPLLPTTALRASEQHTSSLRYLRVVRARHACHVVRKQMRHAVSHAHTPKWQMSSLHISAAHASSSAAPDDSV